MSFRSQAADDFRENLVSDGDPVILTDSDSVEHELTGKVVRTDVTIDPGTKEKLQDAKTRVTLALGDLPESFDEGMSVRAADVTGEVVTGVVMSPDYDKTLGFVAFIIEVEE